MQLLLLISLITINLSLSTSTPLPADGTYSGASGGSASAPAQHSATSSRKIKVVSGVDNNSKAEAGILEVDVGTNVGVDLLTNTSLANGVLAGGLTSQPLFSTDSLDLGKILGGLSGSLSGGLGSLGSGLGSGLESVGKAGLPSLPALPKPDKGVIDELIHEVEESKKPAPVAPKTGSNPLQGLDLSSLGEISPDLLSGLSSVFTSLQPASKEENYKE